jgi:hypothetical protein
MELHSDDPSAVERLTVPAIMTRRVMFGVGILARHPSLIARGGCLQLIASTRELWTTFEICDLEAIVPLRPGLGTIHVGLEHRQGAVFHEQQRTAAILQGWMGNPNVR